MDVSASKLTPCLPVLVATVALACGARPAAVPRKHLAEQGGCTPEQRARALSRMQAQVLQAAPRQLESLAEATAPGGSLAGWRLSHGHVVMAGGGAVAVDNLQAMAPLPHVLLYAPSPATAPEEWLDFDGPDAPYTLVGWAHVAPYGPRSRPPALDCIAASEWFIHEAGWHLLDGDMLLTPGAAAEPPRPPRADNIYFWHPRVWDIHFWVAEDGPPAVSFSNPRARHGGLELPVGSFFRLEDGRKRLIRQVNPRQPRATARD